MMKLYAVALGVAVLAGIAGCGESDEPNAGAPGGGAAACAFQAGALPAQTLPAGTPHGARIPIQHVVVLMQENHSFDNYFGRLPAAGKADVDGLPVDAGNPDQDGTAVAAAHQASLCTADTDHSWTGSHREFDDGKNDGFVVQNNPGGGRAMDYYDETDLPFYYALAKTFAIGDRYFCSVLGPTFPNRFYLLTGTSFGHVQNDQPHGGGFAQPSIFGLLDAHGVSWRVYYGDLPYAQLFRVNRQNLVRMPQFFSDAAAGTLPQVSFVDSQMGVEGVELDEHPPADIQQGQQFAAQVIEAVIAGPSWPDTALFLTYDENGGFYDHVPPPPACVPDTIGPTPEPHDPTTDFPASFDRYGFRVPLVVVSPYARPGFVSHTVYDHTSILRFIETRFDLPALTARDANARPLLDLFDFAHQALLDPPALPAADVDAGALAQCRAEFPQQRY